MVAKMLPVLFLFASSLIAQQSTTVTISDSNGGQTTGTIRNGNVYFQDSHGNSSFGTIKDGHVFLNTDKGETTFGTIKNGNVFLTDQRGNTTGTIRNGQIFLNNSDGSTTTGTYDRSGNMHTYTTPSPAAIQQEQENQQQQQQQELEQQREKQQRDYEAGAAAGQVIGSGITVAIENHRINSYCKSNPAGIYIADAGIRTLCPNSPLNNWEQQQIDSYCEDNPGSSMGFGKHMVQCVTAPDTPNLKWAIWELKSWRWDYTHQKDKAVIANAATGDQMRERWEYWRGIYCQLSQSGATYKDLSGKKQHCN